ncbi:unnamed protein product [Urochloa decumbens]|uniref:Uncharacterized protein n=1 Tax=Urochloa decumbens TaxID=240449 RepID=A0ABC9ERH9_9POAL
MMSPIPPAASAARRLSSLVLAPSPAPTHSPTLVPSLAPASPSPKMAGTPSPVLSPTARPFYPGESSSARRRWADVVEEEEGLDQVDYEFSPSPSASPSGSPRPTTYLEAVRSPRPASPPRPTPVVSATPAAAAGHPGAPSLARRRRRPGRRARKRNPPPLRPVAAPAEASRRRPRVDEDGFQEALSRSTRRRLRREEQATHRPPSSSTSPSRRIPPELADRCLRCLSYSHLAPALPALPACSGGGWRTAPGVAPTCDGGTCTARSGRWASGRAALGFGGSASPRRRDVSPAGCPAVRSLQQPADAHGLAGSKSHPVTTAAPPGPRPPPPHSPAGSTDSHPMGEEPELECCYMERSAAMAEEEARLRLALIAQVGNASRVFTAVDVASAITAAIGLGVEAFRVVPSFPASFLIICNSQGARDCVLGMSPIPLASTSLSILPWTRVRRASSRVLYFKVGLEIDGIPEHAWDIDTARQLLDRHAWVERLDHATASKEDMTTFKLTAWTEHPNRIPTNMTLSVAEPEREILYSDDEMGRIFSNLVPYLRQKIVLDYPVSIHLRSIADYRPRTPSTSSSSPSEDGDSGPDGNPDRSYGFRRGVGPRLSGFPRRGGDSGTAARDGDRTSGSSAPGFTHANGGGAAAVDGGGASAAGQSTDKEPQEERPTSADRTVPQGHFPKVDSNIGKPTSGDAGDGRQGDFRNDLSTVAVQTTGPVLTATDKPAAPALPDPDWLVASACLQGGEPGPPRPDPMLIEVCSNQWLREPIPEPSTATQLLLEKAVQTPPACGSQSPPARQGQASPDEPAGHAATVTVSISGSPPGPGCTVASGHTPTASRPAEDGLNQLGPNATQDGLDQDEPGSPPGFLRAAIDEHSAKLRAFTSDVTLKIRSPLAPKPAKTMRVAHPPRQLPKRSERLASHPLANVASSKRAEVVLMRRFAGIPDSQPVNEEGKRAYLRMYADDLRDSNFEAMSDLMPALRNASPILGMQA